MVLFRRSAVAVQYVSVCMCVCVRMHVRCRHRMIKITIATAELFSYPRRSLSRALACPTSPPPHSLTMKYTRRRGALDDRLAVAARDRLCVIRGKNPKNFPPLNRRHGSFRFVSRGSYARQKRTAHTPTAQQSSALARHDVIILQCVEYSTGFLSRFKERSRRIFFF